MERELQFVKVMLLVGLPALYPSCAKAFEAVPPMSETWVTLVNVKVPLSVPSSAAVEESAVGWSVRLDAVTVIFPEEEFVT